MSSGVPRLAAIGLICAAWAELENKIATTIWATLGLDIPTGKIVTGGLDMMPRINLAVRLLRHRKAPRYIITAMEKVRVRVQDGLDQRRNQAIHGLHLPAEEEGKFYLDMMRGKGALQPTPISNDDLKAIHEEIGDVSAEFREPFYRWLEECSRPARHISRKTRAAASDKDSTSGSKSAKA